MMLERLGYRVYVAKNGAEAIQMIRTLPRGFDLAMLDVVLPDMDCLNVYRRLLDSHPQLKIMLCSGFNKDGPVQQVLDAGAHGFIQKPYSLQRLSEQLSELLP